MRFSLLSIVCFATALLVVRTGRAQTAALHEADVEACGGYIDRSFPAEMRRAHHACIGERRLARVIDERDRVAAIHHVPTIFVLAGYDGALYAYDARGGRYRSPSLVLSMQIRRNVLDRFGLYATLGAALGHGVIGGGDLSVRGLDSVNAGASFTGLLEFGITMGPFRRVYGLLGPQLRLIVPSRNAATFVFDERDGVVYDMQTVHWDSPLFGLGGRLALGLMVGREHTTFLELGGGVGAVVAKDAVYVTLGARVGHTFAR